MTTLDPTAPVPGTDPNQPPAAPPPPAAGRPAPVYGEAYNEALRALLGGIPEGLTEDQLNNLKSEIAAQSSQGAAQARGLLASRTGGVGNIAFALGSGQIEASSRAGAAAEFAQIDINEADKRVALQNTRLNQMLQVAGLENQAQSAADSFKTTTTAEENLTRHRENQIATEHAKIQYNYADLSVRHENAVGDRKLGYAQLLEAGKTREGDERLREWDLSIREKATDAQISLSVEQHDDLMMQLERAYRDGASQRALDNIIAAFTAGETKKQAERNDAIFEASLEKFLLANGITKEQLEALMRNNDRLNGGGLTGGSGVIVPPSSAGTFGENDPNR